MVLEVNQNNTKYIFIDRSTNDPPDLIARNYTFQDITDYNYFGTNLNKTIHVMK